MSFVVERDTQNPAGDPIITDVKVPQIDDTGASGDEYDRFVRLAKRLVQVAKDEITDQSGIRE
jgi:hypothetical protein